MPEYTGEVGGGKCVQGIERRLGGKVHCTRLNYGGSPRRAEQVPDSYRDSNTLTHKFIRATLTNTHTYTHIHKHVEWVKTHEYS